MNTSQVQAEGTTEAKALPLGKAWVLGPVVRSGVAGHCRGGVGVAAQAVKAG